MKKKAIIYPYNSACAPVIKNRDLLSHHEIVACVSPTGFGICGKDAGYCYGGEDTGIVVTNSYDDIDFDDLLLCESVADFKTTVFPGIENAVKRGKDIVILYDLNDSYLCEAKRLCAEYRVNLTVLERRGVNTEHLLIEGDEILPIGIPVIFVLAVIENTNKFDIQLALRRHLLKEGYQVSQIGSKQYCELFGFHSIPRFMFCNEYLEKEKIILFNRVAKSIEIDEQADVMIIGIPGGTMIFNNEITNNFGILPYEIANAIHPDAAVMAVTHENYDAEFLEKVKISIRYKLGFDITCFNMANKKFDSSRSKQEKRLRYITVGTEQVDEKILQMNLESSVPIFNSLNSKSCLSLCKYVQEQLTGHNFQTI